MILHDADDLIETTFKRSPAEVERLIDEHTLAVQHWLSSRSPESTQKQRDGVWLSSTGESVARLNLAVGGLFPHDASNDQLDAKISHVQTFFAERDVPWAWWVSPRAPSRLGERLLAAGLTRRSSLLPAMAAPLPAALPAQRDGLQVWRAASLADLHAACTIRRTAFGFPDGVALHYFENMPESWLSEDSPARLYLAAKEGEPPGGMGAWIMGAGIPGIYIMATLPEWQRQGMGVAILRRLLLDAADHSGSDMIVLTASSKGYGLYRKFGFLHITDYDIYRWEEST
ncbi:MAG: GNAT family N-acetyltransferase [Chloroflexi bacterium]|nr:GNAT family N-acetyltransferase [Chloroflexota bacterium]